MKLRTLALFLSLAPWLSVSGAIDPASIQKLPPNYDETKVGNLAIPDVLTRLDGKKIENKEAWEAYRPELLKAFQNEIYGTIPADFHPNLPAKVIFEDPSALSGKAIMRIIRLSLDPQNPESFADILLYLPTSAAKQPVPVFVGLNFWGNHAITLDERIPLNPHFFRSNKDKGIVDNRATEKSRGVSASRYPLEMILSRGYGIATAYYGDFAPDSVKHYKDAVPSLFASQDSSKHPGCVTVWAWGLSRMADYLTTLPEVNKEKLVVFGHSRLGKTSLWAGVQDSRFSIVTSNDSGAGGSALSKRIFGETVADLCRAAPHWFNEKFREYAHNEEKLPIDQHQLVALVAPRPVYIASASEDLWADPKGEFLSGKLSEPIYQFYGKKGLEVNDPPALDKSIGDFIGYHNREGKHDLDFKDWEHYLNFADRHFGK